jgi:hypothetical protein
MSTEKIIDSDAHVYEPHDIWLRYLDPSLRDILFRTPGLENGNSTGNDGPQSRFPLGFIPETGRQDLLQLAADSETRLKVMDDEGIDRGCALSHPRASPWRCAPTATRAPRYFAPTTIGWPNIVRQIKTDRSELP